MRRSCRWLDEDRPYSTCVAYSRRDPRSRPGHREPLAWCCDAAPVGCPHLLIVDCPDVTQWSVCAGKGRLCSIGGSHKRWRLR